MRFALLIHSTTESTVMLSFLVFICTLCILYGVEGLEMSLVLAPQDSPLSQKACGVLTCTHSKDAGHSTSTISSLQIFKTSLSSPQGNDEGTIRGASMAALTPEQPRFTAVSKTVLINGRLLESRATLRLKFLEEADCSSRYTCEVRTVDAQGKETVHINRLQQAKSERMKNIYLDNMPVKKGDYPQTLILLQQLDTKLAMLSSNLEGKLAALENRIEDKLLSVHDDVLTLKSELTNKIENRVMDKLHQMDRPSNCGDDKHAGVAQNVNGSLITALLNLQQKNQERLENLTQVVGETLTSSESLQARIADDIDLLQRTAHNRSMETVTSVREMLTTQRATIESRLQAQLEGTFLPEGCAKGMVSTTHLGPFPYPRVRPGGMVGVDTPVLCDMITDGGGWIVIQRRTTGNVDFYRGWDEYKRGFGALDDDFWLGNENIHLLSSSGHYELRIEMSHQDRTAFAEYSSFSVDSEHKGYALHLGDYRGSAGDSLSIHDGRKFSTYEMVGGGCAKTYTGAWWYASCHEVNLNGVWGAGSNKGPRWAEFTGSEPVSFSEMKIRRV